MSGSPGAIKPSMNTATNLVEDLGALTLEPYKATGRFTRIPAEILLKIFEYVVQPRPFWRATIQTSQDAYNLCLVCKHFLGPATETLYTSVVVRKGDDVYSEMWQRFFDHASAATHCRKLAIQCGFPKGEHKPDRPKQAPKTGTDHYRPILENLPKLECLHDFGPKRHNPWWPSFSHHHLPQPAMHQANQGKFKNITTIIFEQLQENAFVWAMKALPCLRRLQVIGEAHFSSGSEDRPGT